MYSYGFNNMNILWIRDGKLGHEKQVHALLDEICKTEESNIYERRIKKTSFLSKLNPFNKKIKTIDGLIKNYNEVEKKRDEIDFDIDGIVYKIDD